MVGDTPVVTRLSCLAETASDLRELMIDLILARVKLLCLIEPHVELTREDMVLLANVLKVVIDLGQEHHRRTRRRGIWEAQKAGAYKGRAPMIERERVKRCTVRVWELAILSSRWASPVRATIESSRNWQFSHPVHKGTAGLDHVRLQERRPFAVHAGPQSRPRVKGIGMRCGERSGAASHWPSS
jgi:hypothetical protein